jgi:hypothetical protein
MKKTLFILLILLTGCSNKEERIHYLNQGLQYRLLSSKADFVIKDQQGVLDDGLVSILDSNPLSFRQATQEDRLKAIDLVYNMQALKDFLEESAKHCDELVTLHKGKNIFNSGKRRTEIELYTKFIGITESSMLKLTGGLKPNDYINQFVPSDMKKLSMPPR